MENEGIMENNSNIAIYTDKENNIKIDVLLEKDNVWLNQEKMAELFNTTRENITMHIKKILNSNELDSSVCKKFLHTANDGKKYNTNFYNLDMIIAVGYRVNSLKAIDFRKWATKILKEYMVKGIAMNDEKLKKLGGGNYWKELIERIRDIRSSEKVFYRQILDIYSTSIDYNPKDTTSIEFFKTVQNKIHYAVHGNTAAEVIYNRVDSKKDYMGLMSFSGEEPTLSEAKIAKNYLNENELKALGQIIEGYLAFAERQAERHIPMKMEQWAKHLDNILTVSGEDLLSGKGEISHLKAIEKVEKEYKKYQSKTLSRAEKDYLDVIKEIESKTKNL
jgi:hypothetical protein